MIGAKMGGWLFGEPNPIASFTIGVELSGPIPPPSVRKIAELHQRFKRDLPRKVEQPFFMLPMPGFPVQPPSNQVGAVVFDSVNQDGSVAKSLTIGPAQIMYMTTTYARWKEIQPLIERMLGNVLEHLSDGPKVSAFVFAASNTFRWSDGPVSDARLDGLLNQASTHFAPSILQTAEHCHSFHGYVEPRIVEPRGQYVRNINIQTGDEESLARVATVLLSHRVIFAPTSLEAHTLFKASGNDPSSGIKLANEMHEKNNALFMDVIAPAITSRIPGLS